MRGIVFLCLLGCSLAQNVSYSWNGPGPTPKPDPNTDNACLTDSATCGCCLMQKQMWKLETFFNMSLNELQKGLERAQGALNTIRTSRSAFSVALTDTRRCVGPNRDDVVVKYQSVFINLGDGYNAATGVFTVPRSGVYALALTVYSDAGAAGALLAACGRIRRNGRQIASLSEMNTQDQEDSATVVLAVQLQAGDKVDVILPAPCYLCDDNSHYNTFSGFLLYATD
ncbi:complement C1q-like protein 4 [Astyanax mexicanus]|uniref:Complement C1q-like protein 4 n=1 Tax=Astyanax mexicanus TaxID=7994 RepID=A0A8B9HPA2_ASTMX|nr:complement C1q-like protein 4 [Astyanax mexicanus]